MVWVCVHSVDMLITQKGIQSMKKEIQEPDYDELRKEREIQKGIKKQEAAFDEQQYWEDIADSNPDDGSWIGR